MIFGTPATTDFILFRIGAARRLTKVPAAAVAELQQELQTKDGRGRKTIGKVAFATTVESSKAAEPVRRKTIAKVAFGKLDNAAVDDDLQLENGIQEDKTEPVRRKT